MDPSATLAAMLAAIANRDRETFLEYADYLSEWCGKGGFLPRELEIMADDLRRELDDFETVTGRRELDEMDDGDTLDFRIFIRPDGALDLAVGAPCYDTDHRGYCGAGAVSPHDDNADIRAAIIGAIADAKEQAAQDLCC